MKSPHFLSALRFTAIAAALCFPVFAQSSKPNVVVILADDLGYADLGVQGGKDIPTPHVDSIARNGIRFTQAYVSSPYCSPSRAGLNTGRYQTHFGHEYNEPAPDQRANFGLPFSEKTMGDRFKAEGYVTGVIGKWHLGYTPDHRPTARGYDEFYGTLGNTPYVFATNFMDSRKPAEPVTLTDPNFYTTDAYAERAVDFIKGHVAQPFLLYLPFNAVHMPARATRKYLDRFPKIEIPERRLYAAMVSAMDDAVGRVLAALREIRREEDTLIFFASDNGGPMTKMGPNGSSNGGLRGEKGDVWEGGIHVPFFIQWKAKLPMGKIEHRPVISLDILPTAIAATGGKSAADWRLDGVNLLPFLEGKDSGNPHDHLCWRFGPQWAIRQGNWKLAQGFDPVATPTPPPRANFYKVTKPQLFDLSADPGETRNLVAVHPEKVAALKALYDKWNAGNKDPSWLPNPIMIARKKK